MMHTSPAPTWRRRLLAVAAGTGAGLLAFFVAANLLMINFAPILHHLRLEVLVFDSATRAPLAGADVGWHIMSSEARYERTEALGTTDAEGRLTVERTLQEQPLWLWPPIGCFEFRNAALHVAAKSYVGSVVRLADALPAVSYGVPEGTVRVLLVRCQ